MFGSPWIYHWMKSGGRAKAARLSRWRTMADEICRRSEAFESIPDGELTAAALELRRRARRGEDVDRLKVESFALVREASRRLLGMAHYPVQLVGGMAMMEGHIAEMQTGEGKTLTALLPAFLRALPGRGCHVVTVNDYLARRDSDWMRPVYAMLGLTVGCIQADMENDERRAAYDADVTYTTAKELGFDFLRDRMRTGASPVDRVHSIDRLAQDGEPPVIARGHYFALVDEADSVLIDDARTPLIIGLKEPSESSVVALNQWGARLATRLKPSVDYHFRPDRRQTSLTVTGRRNIVGSPKPRLLDSVGIDDLVKQIERAITAVHGYERDRDYLIREDEIVIIDESTGRVMEGRKWQDGLHQAVEAKEMLPLSTETAVAARVTMQRFFAQYAHLAGMTGTAITSAGELKSSYQLRVTPIPTNLDCRRTGEAPRIFVSLETKWAAIVEQVAQCRAAGRAVLIGTPSVAASEGLREQLEAGGIPHQLLNARHDKREAAIVAEAGQPGRVTIATNMAGRGTDISLHPDVRESGGLHVIGSEMHSSVRIDRQMTGRAARHGDPGSFQFFLSLEDELLRCRPSEELKRLRLEAQPNTSGELPQHWLQVFTTTQRHLEKQHRRQRKRMLRTEEDYVKSLQQLGLDPFLEMCGGM